MTFFKSIEGETRRDKIKNKIYWETVNQNLLTEIEEKWLQWFGHVKRIEKGWGPEDGDSVFLWNVAIYQQIYMVPKLRTSSVLMMSVSETNLTLFCF
jgi:hypothetical protein